MICENRASRIAVGCFLCGAILFGVDNARAQKNSSPYSVLSPAKLQALGAHLPEYISTIQDQLVYQDQTPIRQSFTVSWNKSDVASSTPESYPKIVRRDQHIARQLGNQAATHEETRLLIVSTTKKGEIRGLAATADEGISGQPITFEMPQDGQISSLIFVSVNKNGETTLLGKASVIPDGAQTGVQNNTRKHISR
jgi:hypothetical protein